MKRAVTPKADDLTRADVQAIIAESVRLCAKNEQLVAEMEAERKRYWREQRARREQQEQQEHK